MGMIKTIIEHENRIYSLLSLLKEIINDIHKDGKITFNKLSEKYNLDIVKHDINIFLKETMFEEKLKEGK